MNKLILLFCEKPVIIDYVTRINFNSKKCLPQELETETSAGIQGHLVFQSGTQVCCYHSSVCCLYSMVC